ncbi:uncharacterized protein B0H18DRAFT_1139683 [Fomitopsis serialis]|uniref:uncharacterized protein n=1 Tax=Fomitopsis serialis TaxID=139415 RepID=UPI002007F1DC|nr:uncharacterized protein B0H18DRAFT_1139683 [Neoantrodia serialis]KAH9916153.1 hypothetical protein B0H18DRAFT_1139683 [Neoantrodia serialis]
MSLPHSLGDQIFTSPLYWAKATNFPETAAHAIDFVKREEWWSKKFMPSLVKGRDGKTHFDTPFSRLLGKPPNLVARMVSSAPPWRLGITSSLLAGGHYNAAALRTKVAEIQGKIPAGVGITLNSLYINPRQFGFRFPLWQEMCREGLPLEGFCAAAGIPSTENAAKINGGLEAVGTRRISFKPGSVGGIRQVVNIAAANPDFPIILQWTGGRAGGHHSCEDFHQPILSTYHSIRRHSNISLFAGSGFDLALLTGATAHPAAQSIVEWRFGLESWAAGWAARQEQNSVSQLKPPRPRSLPSESRPEDEMRSEAQFQRLVASFCELPSPHRVQRPPPDQGRYPEEAGTEEPRRPDTPSGDSELEEAAPSLFVDPIAIPKSVTPAASVNGEGGDMSMLDSPAMDVDARMIDTTRTRLPTSGVRSPSISFARDNQPSSFTPVLLDAEQQWDTFNIPQCKVVPVSRCSSSVVNLTPVLTLIDSLAILSAVLGYAIKGSFTPSNSRILAASTRDAHIRLSAGKSKGTADLMLRSAPATSAAHDNGKSSLAMVSSHARYAAGGGKGKAAACGGGTMFALSA